MATLTVAEKLAIAEINEYLISNAIRKGGLNGGGIDLQLPTKIRMIREAIQYRYDGDPSDTSLTATSNYLLGLCLYVAAAKNITGNGGTIAGVHVAGNAPDPYRFIVDASTTFMIDGESSKTITAFIGYNLIYVRGGIDQSTQDDGSGSYFSWTKSTGSFITFPALNTGENIQLIAV
jgi:hypothetical protein